MINNGQHQEAVGVLSILLKGLRKEMAHGGTEYLEVPINSIVDQCMLHDGIPTMMNLGGVQDQEGENGRPFVYSKAIRIPPSLANSCKQSLVAITSIVIFNLALVHHLNAGTNDPSDLNLQKALKLYALGLRIQQAEAFGSNMVFTLAIFNNSGAIYHSLNEQKLSFQCLGEVLSILLLLQDDRRAVGDGISNEPNFLNGFYHNVQTLFVCKGAAAAAAA